MSDAFISQEILRGPESKGVIVTFRKILTLETPLPHILAFRAVQECISIVS